MKYLQLFTWLFFSLTAQAQLINGDFETWIDYLNCNNPDSVPENWETQCTQPLGYFSEFEKTADAQSGNWAVLLPPSEIGDFIPDSVPTVMSTSFAVSNMPEMLSGYFKYNDQGTGDSAAVFVWLKKYNSGTGQSDTIGSAYMKLGNQSNYTQFSLPITEPFTQPDSVDIAASSEYYDIEMQGFPPTNSGGILYVDNLELTMATGLGGQPQVGDFWFYPNPVEGGQILQCGTSPKLNTSVMLEVFNANGTNVYSSSIGEREECQLNTRGWASGLYFIQISGEDMRYIRKLIITSR